MTKRQQVSVKQREVDEAKCESYAYTCAVEFLLTIDHSLPAQLQRIEARSKEDLEKRKQAREYPNATILCQNSGLQ